MDKNTSDPLRHWLTPAQAAAERARKQSESKRIWGMVLLSGIISGALGLAVGSLTGFVFSWIMLGAMLTSFACDEKEGPGT